MRWPVLVLLTAGLAFPRVAAGQATQQRSGYSAYERFSLDEVGKKIGSTVDREAEGKTIESVEVFTLEVLEDRDPLPKPLATIVNSLHTTTRPYVIRREVLQRQGDAYQQDLADETARNLRGAAQNSLVIVAPFKGSAADRVRLVIISKDVWSLRLGFDLGFSAGGKATGASNMGSQTGLERLLVEPTESNIAGSQQTALGRFRLRPETYSLGGGYVIPRLQGHRLRFVADANVIINRRSGDPEGSFGSLSLVRPLYSRRVAWSWGTNVQWSQEIARRYIGINVARYDAQVTPGRDDIPWQYRATRFTSTHAATRSFGEIQKNDFSFGLEMNRRAFRTTEAHDALPRAAVDEFVRLKMPVSDTRVGPFVQWRSYTSRFLRILDFDTLALQEDYRLGHDVWVRVYPVTRALGSTRDFIGTYAAAQYTVPFFKDGIVRAGVEALTEAEAERLSDAALEANVAVVTPRLVVGRLVLAGAALNRYRNSINRLSSIGGDTRLRGFPTDIFNGKDVLAMNAELRTRPLVLLGCALGAAVFYDAANAFTGWDNLTLHQSVGGGLRFLVPQVNKVVFRADVGFPLDRPLPPGVNAYGLFFAFDQAFELASVGTAATTGAPSTAGVLGQ